MLLHVRRYSQDRSRPLDALHAMGDNRRSFRGPEDRMKRLALAAVLCWLAAPASADAVGPIAIGGTGPASPYPSVLDIQGFSQIIEDVDVRINDVTHEFPDELDVAIVGPDGTAVMLMSDVGQPPELACKPDFRFSSEATGPVPSDIPLPCGGTYQPTDDDSDEFDLDGFPDPGPADAPGSSLTVFNGQTPNGTWKLFVVDDTSGDGGAIDFWTLSFNTRAFGNTRQASPPTSNRSEHDGVLQFAIRRSGGSSAAPLQAATVDWVAHDCLPDPLVSAPPPSAVLGSDFLPAGGTVALAPGQTDALGEVGIVNDEVPEGRECVAIQLTGVTGDARLNTDDPGLTRALFITDDDLRASAPKVTAAPGQRVVRQRGIVLTAVSRVTGTLSATGTIAVPRVASAVVRMKPASVSVTAGGAARLKLGLSKKALKAVKRGFKKRRALTATIRVTETDLAGGQATTLKRLKLRR
jgi:subtilisin-like proprotein convertase family protein